MIIKAAAALKQLEQNHRKLQNFTFQDKICLNEKKWV